MRIPWPHLWLVALWIIPSVSSCGDDESNPMAGQARTGTGKPPSITAVSWTHAAGCSPGTPGTVTITVTVADPDTDPANLTISGSVSSCNGQISAVTSIITCPQAGTYSGQATVKDPEGNTGTMSFSFGPCQDGRVP